MLSFIGFLTRWRYCNQMSGPGEGTATILIPAEAWDGFEKAVAEILKELDHSASFKFVTRPQPEPWTPDKFRKDGQFQTIQLMGFTFRRALDDLPLRHTPAPMHKRKRG